MKPSNDREAVTLITQGLVDAGCAILYVWDSEENVPCKTVDEAVDTVMDVDIASLWVRMPEGPLSFVQFVLGNEPEEVASDYGISLSNIIEPIIDPWWGRV